MSDKSNTKKVYQIRDPKTGLYQTGGAGPRGEACWSKAGKVWKTLGHLKAHLTLLREYAQFDPTGGRHYWRKGKTDPVDPTWELVEYEVTTLPAATRTIGDILK